jgi:hypothetical protein
MFYTRSRGLGVRYQKSKKRYCTDEQGRQHSDGYDEPSMFSDPAGRLKPERARIPAAKLHESILIEPSRFCNTSVRVQPLTLPPDRIVTSLYKSALPFVRSNRP